jgi:aryl-alcohol dehydrogenase-like predicted oxidoreductase
MQQSLSKLRVPATHPLALMQVHNLLDLDTHLETLREWKAQKRIRYIGLTHYTASAYADVAKALEKHPVDFLQINYSAAEREAEQRLLPLARERKIAVLINRPFAGGSVLRALQNKALPSVAKELECVSWAQLLLKFVLAQTAVTCVIPATSKLDHLRDNMRAGQGALPNEKQLREILAAT